ncbi:MAG TPA: disulfide oxidoreductase [Stellaceae bacterium]|nr:disulfide oxidoreductase [Stellaceae bacterium]
MATDAIGMGLNMDLDHVAFARLIKFDGHAPRRLAPAEVAQIAGRAGRHMNDGTFGVTDEIKALDDVVVEAVENHRFDPLARLYWRNARLDYRSLGALIASLERRPDLPGLVSAPQADDHGALRALAQMADVAAMTTNPAAVRLLWEVCQIPDFRKVLSDTHARLLAQIYHYLAGPRGRLPTDWVASQVDRLDRADGDIDTLMMRIAHIRTWTYIAHRADWLDDSGAWQERARTIEDNLSDALHDRITQRFVDKRAAYLMRRLADPRELLASVSEAGEVKVEGHYVGRLDGFRFRPDLAASGDAAKTLLAAAQRVLRGEIARRVARLANAPDREFALTANGTLAWNGGTVGRLIAGAQALQPRVEAIASDYFEGEQRETVRRRLAAFAAAYLRRCLAPLFRARDAELSAPARGLAFQLAEALGSLPMATVAPVLRALSSADRKALTRLGIRLGVDSVYHAGLFAPDAIALRGLLWSVAARETVPAAPSNVGAPSDPAVSAPAYAAMGYRVLGPRVLRIDRIETFAARLRGLARQGAFAITPSLAALAHCPTDELAAVLLALGYRATQHADGARFAARRTPARHRRRGRRRRSPGEAADSPFAKLKELCLVR